MRRGSKAELERLVQDLERRHPEWTASRIEKELASLAPVAYGDWRDETPVPRSRHRQVLRWRGGDVGRRPLPEGTQPYRHLWPVGEKQRAAMDSAFQARASRLRASQRLFLYNCSEEKVREVRVEIAGREVTFEPVLEPGRFSEIHWVRNEAVRAAALAAQGHDELAHPLRADFAFSKGMKRGRLEGVLTMDATDGWVRFTCPGSAAKEIE